MTRRDHLDRRMAEGMETVLADLARSAPKTETDPPGSPSQRFRVVAAFVIVLALLVPAGIFAFSDHSRRGTPPATAVPVHITPTAATIGALPKRSSLLIHGEAELQPLDPARADDLRGYADQMHLDPAKVLADNATSEAFDAAVRTAESGSTGFADAVYEQGRHAASVLRFVDRPAERLLATLRREYPGELRIEWGEKLAGDRDRDAFSAGVFRAIADVPGVDRTSVLTGIDGDGRLTAGYGGTASLRSVVDALLESVALRALFVDGQPPTEIRITGGPLETGRRPTPSATASAAASEPGAALVGLWKVRAAGEGDRTWVAIGPEHMEVERDRRLISADWATGDDRLVATVTGWDGSLQDHDVPWLDRAATFTWSGADVLLQAADGTVLATLSPAARAPTPIGAGAGAVAPPTISPADAARLEEVRSPEVGDHALTEQALRGTWQTGDAASDGSRPFLRFEADDVYGGSDGCNGVGGKWLVLPGNRMVFTDSGHTDVGCPNLVDVPRWITATRTAAIGDDRLTLFDADGKRLGSLERKG